MELALDGRMLPMGAVGRVSRVEAERVWVDVVGFGQVELAREDVLIRKRGQARYAARRFAAWEALASTVVLRTVVGSLHHNPGYSRPGLNSPCGSNTFSSVAVACTTAR